MESHQRLEDKPAKMARKALDSPSAHSAQGGGSAHGPGTCRDCIRNDGKRRGWRNWGARPLGAGGGPGKSKGQPDTNNRRSWPMCQRAAAFVKIADRSHQSDPLVIPWYFVAPAAAFRLRRRDVFASSVEIVAALTVPSRRFARQGLSNCLQTRTAHETRLGTHKKVGPTATTRHQASEGSCAVGGIPDASLV